MVGLMPTWEHMLHNRLLEDYESQLNAMWLFLIFLWFVSNKTTKHKCPMSFWDLLRIGWSIPSGKLGKLRSRNSALDSSFSSSCRQQRLDHFLSPSRARLTIVSDSTVSQDIVHCGAVQFNYQLLQAYKFTWDNFWIRLPESPSKRIVKWVAWYALPLGFHFHLHVRCFVILLHFIVF